MTSGNDEFIDEVGEQLETADYAIILPLNKNTDETISCLVCGCHKCEYSILTIGKTRRSFHGLHMDCAEPYLAHKDLLYAGDANGDSSGDVN